MKKTESKTKAQASRRSAPPCSAFDVVATLRAQAQEIANAGHAGWGNTMTAAADEIERLRNMPNKGIDRKDAK